jgi:hypothetical protein
MRLLSRADVPHIHVYNYYIQIWNEFLPMCWLSRFSQESPVILSFHSSWTGYRLCYRPSRIFGWSPGAKMTVQFDQRDTSKGQLLIVFLLPWNIYSNALIEYRCTLTWMTENKETNWTFLATCTTTYWGEYTSILFAILILSLTSRIIVLAIYVELQYS